MIAIGEVLDLAFSDEGVAALLDSVARQSVWVIGPAMDKHRGREAGLGVIAVECPTVIEVMAAAAGWAKDKIAALFDRMN